MNYKNDKDFNVKLDNVANSLGVEPNFLRATIHMETGGTFDPSIKNPGSSATGLIQFMSATAKNLGTTTSKLSKMTGEEQLDYVEKYFKPWKGKLKTLGDVYAAVLWPAAVGKPANYVLFRRGTEAYRLNAPAFDLSQKGYVTKKDITKKLQSIYDKNYN